MTPNPRSCAAHPFFRCFLAYLLVSPQVRPFRLERYIRIIRRGERRYSRVGTFSRNSSNPIERFEQFRISEDCPAPEFANVVFIYDSAGFAGFAVSRRVRIVTSANYFRLSRNRPRVRRYIKDGNILSEMFRHTFTRTR